MKIGTTEYRTLHQWVERQLGKPQSCVECGTTAPRRYHWANVSGEYKRDVTDWKRLCVPCHKKYDRRFVVARAVCRLGHDMTPENTYIRPDKRRVCRTCRRQQHKATNALTNPLRQRGTKV